VADPQGHRPWGVRGDTGRPGTVRDVVELRLPADPAYLSVLRTATAGLAARLDFTLDEIEDLRIAVDEACAMLLPDVVDSGTLTCTFEMLEDALRITVAAPTHEGHEPERGTFAWTVLTALAGEVESGTDAEGRVTVRLHKRRGAAG
jgi:serine/threonine-protein kinase RsbW